MQVSTYAKAIAAALSIAALAGCASDGSNQGDANAARNGAMTSGANSAGMNGSQGMNGQGMGNDQIPMSRTVYFDFDRDTIRPEFESVLNQNASYLRSNSGAKVTLQGHTDPRGTREYNLGLGERRANAVRQYLAVQGVNASQIEVVSYGQERPACAERSDQCYSQDRRVVFDY